MNLYEALGLSGGLVLILGALYVTVATGANFMASVTLDRIGRVRLICKDRKLWSNDLTITNRYFWIYLVIGLAGCMISLILLTVMEARFMGTSNRAGNSMGVFFIFTYILFFGWGLDAPSYVYCSEIFPTHIRSAGMSFSMVGTFLANLAYVQSAPTALSSITWKYYLIFICLTAINIGIIAFTFPEVCCRFHFCCRVQLLTL